MAGIAFSPRENQSQPSRGFGQVRARIEAEINVQRGIGRAAVERCILKRTRGKVGA
jgi:hypothetical protein